MIERFIKKSPEISQETAEDPIPLPNRAQARRLIELCKDFDGTIRRNLGDEVADKYAQEQKDVASKVHRIPPDSLGGMRL